MVFSEDEVNKVIEVHSITGSQFVTWQGKGVPFCTGMLTEDTCTLGKLQRKHLKKGHIQHKRIGYSPGHFLSVRNCPNMLLSATLEDEMGQSYTEDSSTILLQRSPLC
ncbi:uncharacterized protein LOC144626969 [Crassostrea virginica]